MVEHLVFGEPFQTDVVVGETVETDQLREFKLVETDDSLTFDLELYPDEVVYGLGETMRGVNKRGGRYVMFNVDDNDHRDDMPSMYGGHGLIILDSSKRHIGFIFDCPARIVFDVDSNGDGHLRIEVEDRNLNLYTCQGQDSYSISREFLKVLGRSYIPPLWAFGYGQSRWGYHDSRRVRELVRKHRELGIPLDYVCLDIDHMDRCADFSVDPKNFGDFRDMVSELRKDGVRIVPIVDCGIRIDEDDPEYVSARDRGLFCTDRDGKPLPVAVWPGWTNLPDFFQPAAREWFGSRYRFYTDMGIEGFWNDMNEPSIFYTEESRDESQTEVRIDPDFEATGHISDYGRLYHRIGDQRVCNMQVHNAYSSLMVRGSSEGLNKLMDSRYMLFSRSSYLGGHRYGGIWTGDNRSTWHMLQSGFRMLLGINMCGFLYSGTDTGGFMGDCDDRSLLLRWLAFSAFTPIFRNHSCKGTRHQEVYRYGSPESFRKVISLRYRILPYIYSEYVKAALNYDLYLKPLSFIFPKDQACRTIEDQCLVGESIMIAPIMKPKKRSRMVYLPEDMTKVEYDGRNFAQTPMTQGWHKVEMPLSHVVFFIRKGHCVPVGKPAQCTDEVNLEDVELIGDGEEYFQYLDDGLTKDVNPSRIRRVARGCK